MFVLMFAVVFEAQNYGRFLFRSFAADLDGKLHSHFFLKSLGHGGVAMHSAIYVLYLCCGFDAQNCCIF